MYDILQLNEMLVPELREVAEQIGLTQYKKLTKQELILPTMLILVETLFLWMNFLHCPPI